MTTSIGFIVIICLQVIQFGVTGVVLLVLFRVKTKRDSEFYTDYVKGKITLRVFKAEFEYQAIGNILPSKIIDAGNLTLSYRWAMIES